MMECEESDHYFEPEEPMTVDEILQSDPLFVELARTLVQQNYYETVFKRQKGSLREMREDDELTPVLLFVNTPGIEDMVYDDETGFRGVGLADLGALIVHETDPDGFVDEYDHYQDPSVDGGYFVRRFDDGRMLVSREKDYFEEFGLALQAHNLAYPGKPEEKFKDLLLHYLPGDFLSVRRDSFKPHLVGTRTRAALAAALSGASKTKSYIVKQTVYDGVTGKLVRFGNDGIEMEFFLYRMSPTDEDIDLIESYHPVHAIQGVLRVYNGKDDRQTYSLGPSKLGRLTVPAPAHKVGTPEYKDALDGIGKNKK